MRPDRGQFRLVAVPIKIPYASATVGLFGLCRLNALLAEGRFRAGDPDRIADAIRRPAYFADFGPNVPVEDLGGSYTTGQNRVG